MMCYSSIYLKNLFYLQYDFQEKLKISLLPMLLRNLEAVAKTSCGKVGHIFSKRVAQFLN